MKPLFLPAALLADLQQVEQTVRDRVRSNPAAATVVRQQLGASQGSLHATLILLTARLGMYQLEKVLHAAAALELIHAATYIHSRLVDQARRRRGLAPPRPDWQHELSLMVGNYLFALAATEMALTTDSRTITYFSQAVMALCESVLLPVMHVRPLDRALQEYYSRIGGTIAGLLGVACKAGMIGGGGTPAQIEQLGRFGYDFGLAWQIVHDICDFTPIPVSEQPGPGDSLRRGVVTLPFLYTLHAGDATTLLAALDTTDEVYLSRAMAEVRRLGVDPALEDARKLMSQALGYLDAFPDSTARQAIGDIGEAVLAGQLFPLHAMVRGQ